MTTAKYIESLTSELKNVEEQITHCRARLELFKNWLREAEEDNLEDYDNPQYKYHLSEKNAYRSLIVQHETHRSIIQGILLQYGK